MDIILREAIRIVKLAGQEIKALHENRAFNKWHGDTFDWNVNP